MLVARGVKLHVACYHSVTMLCFISSSIDIVVHPQFPKLAVLFGQFQQLVFVYVLEERK